MSSQQALGSILTVPLRNAGGGGGAGTTMMKIFAIGFGTYQIPPGEETYKSVRSALDLGYRHIDTAQFYNNEADVGRAIRDSGIPRNEIFVTTKISTDFTEEEAYKSGVESCKKIGLGHVDLLLMHAPWPKRLEIWKAMEKLHKEGVAKAIGVSNFGIAHMKELLSKCEIPPCVQQQELHPFLFRKEVVDFCASNNIVIEAYSPLARAKALEDKALVKIAEEVGRSAAQVMLKWGIKHGFVVLPKSTHTERQKQNLALHDFDLTDEHMAVMDNLHRDLNTCWDPMEWK